MEHQAFATVFHCFGENSLKRGVVGHSEWHDRFYPWLINLDDQFFERRNSLRERAALRL